MICPLSGAASPSLVARPKHTPRLACEIVREMREMAGFRKSTLALVACGRALPKEQTMLAYFQAPSKGASPRDKADTPPPASPISARPNTPPFWRFRRPSFSALCGRRRLRFLEAAAAFLELARGHLACADSICWRVCRFAAFWK